MNLQSYTCRQKELYVEQTNPLSVLFLTTSPAFLFCFCFHNWGIVSHSLHAYNSAFQPSKALGDKQGF